MLKIKVVRGYGTKEFESELAERLAGGWRLRPETFRLAAFSENADIVYAVLVTKEE